MDMPINKSVGYKSGRLLRRMFIGVILLGLAFAGERSTLEVLAQSAPISDLSSTGHWVGTWSSSPLAADQSFSTPGATFTDQTLRQIVHVSIGGTLVRVRLSNEFGTVPLEVGAAHVALQSEGASIVPGSDRTLTFGEEPLVSIPPGEGVVSDPVHLVFFARSNLAVSIYLPGTTGPATWHEIGKQTAYISPEGNFADAVDLPTSATTEARYFLTGLDVRAPKRSFSVVAFGDSIADGWGSTPDTNRRWPDYLSARLNHSLVGRVGVLNQGISGNRVIFDFMGSNASSRFDRDVLAQAGVEHVIIMIGINDIGFPGAFGLPEQDVTSSQIIEGLSDLVTRARARNLLVYGGTLTPFEGTAFPGYYTPEGEAKREAVNDWIRTSGVFDAVLDFDAVLRDPAHPTQLLAEFDSGDHLHPNDAGYEAMANAIDPDLFSHPCTYGFFVDVDAPLVQSQ